MCNFLLITKKKDRLKNFSIKNRFSGTLVIYIVFMLTKGVCPCLIVPREKIVGKIAAKIWTFSFKILAEIIVKKIKGDCNKKKKKENNERKGDIDYTSLSPHCF